MKVKVLDSEGIENVLEFDKDNIVIGRIDSVDIVLKHNRVSRKHAVISKEGTHYTIGDLGSSNGTFVNDHRITARYRLSHGDVIRIGTFTLSLEDESYQTESPSPEKTEPEKASSRESKPDVAAEMTREAPPLRPKKKRKKKQSQALSKEQEIELEMLKIKDEIHRRLLDYMDLRKMDFEKTREEELRKRTRQLIRDIIAELANDIPPTMEKARIAKEVLDEALGLGPLEDYLADDTITEIMVNNKDQIYIERAGKLELSPKRFSTDDAVQAVIERIVAPIGRRIDESSPLVDARLKDGSRVNAIIPPLALKGPSITIRKFSRDPFEIEDLVRFDSITYDAAEFLEKSVLGRKNIVISGGTGSGKTTLLNVVSAFIPEGERIITIEDAAELQLPQIHVVSLESRPPNIEGKGAIPIRELVKNSLRMRPDRIVVGECRGGEALDMLQAMNTGHDGSLTTAHANSPTDALNRLETMVLMAGMDLPIRAIRDQISSAINIIVQTARYQDGTRKVTYISEVLGLDENYRIQVEHIYKFIQEGIGEEGQVIGQIKPTGYVPSYVEEFKSRGIVLQPHLFQKEA
ncbi:ATPase, T2SS/T4P/T4SS family [candidate division CSSED10-310 bacterium]|uniref:ATPase, T2SS/T4P/T4SS family n=1 Tax=candidate division CSSED10-310 bacterium TaxID=2855610 RepID=A0ABV6YXR7_UNCC1